LTLKAKKGEASEYFMPLILQAELITVSKYETVLQSSVY